MTDDQLRALVRDAVARHLGQTQASTTAPAAVPGTAHAAAVLRHASHHRYTLSSGGDADGPCLIEPSVLCNHCGFCQSHGH
jgi:hypothetical protein